MQVPEEYKKKFTKAEINELPLRQYEGPIKLIDNEEDVPDAIAKLSKCKLLGFDTETRPVFRKGLSYPPSLIQLATDDCVYLLHLSHISLSDYIKKLLSSADIIKTGVAVINDVKELRQVSPFDGKGFVDLGDLARSLEMQTNGLRNLAANLLGFRISKGVQCSNWGRKELTPQQLTYAATDAWVSREIYLKFKDLGIL
ncbi:3'-5' exonuclease [Maridesulfovibrio hydrothermalis]|uniref:3'-5' exonuclease n=1 Tax=Maridesulfovibrio hydrothermalis AM13 = DSM 14728 TaxID=1121451 RepID=L0RBE5_9BACT|nr:3'-5' exonuclease [Maridesulfovibrio hydrothermalis]CCO22886.1 3'-5' exonuclease [Maridesulfovibrio hydrothermalis AM13 = DSM 14728]